MAEGLVRPVVPPLAEPAPVDEFIIPIALVLPVVMPVPAPVVEEPAGDDRVSPLPLVAPPETDPVLAGLLELLDEPLRIRLPAVPPAGLPLVAEVPLVEPVVPAVAPTVPTPPAAPPPPEDCAEAAVAASRVLKIKVLRMIIILRKYEG